MTEKELHRLRRQDLLQLLLSQSKDVARLNADLSEMEDKNGQLKESNDRLIAKLDEKDAQIEHLKQRLNDKDAQIEALKTSYRLELNADGTTGVRLKEIFDVASQAAEEYLHSIVLSSSPVTGELELPSYLRDGLADAGETASGEQGA